MRRFSKIIQLPILTVDYPTDRIAEECVRYIVGGRYTGRIAHAVVAVGSDAGAVGRVEL